MNDKKIEKELARLAKKSGGHLLPEEVVEAARPVRSPLHKKFDWDDGTAAHQWRLQQARMLIRVYVTVIEADGPKESRAYVSLTSDRQIGGGYRTIVDVLGDDDLRAQLLADALADMQRFKLKYAALRELATVFAAIDKLAIKANKLVDRTLAKV